MKAAKTDQRPETWAAALAPTDLAPGVRVAARVNQRDESAPRPFCQDDAGDLALRLDGQPASAETAAKHMVAPWFAALMLGE